MTLEAQHREWQTLNPDIQLTFEEWKDTILHDYIQNALKSIEKYEQQTNQPIESSI